MAHFTYSIEGRIATLVLHHPPQNRIGRQAMGELDVALDAVGHSDARVVLLRADGPDFSFGADITTWDYADVRALRTEFEHDLAVVNRFERLSLPVIAAVQGRAQALLRRKGPFVAFINRERQFKKLIDREALLEEVAEHVEKVLDDQLPTE